MRPNLLFVFFIFTTLTACERHNESDEITLPPLNEQIIGEWEVKAMKGTATSFHYEIGKVEKDTWTGDSITGNLVFSEYGELNLDLKYHRHFQCASWNCPYPKVYGIIHQRYYQYTIDNASTFTFDDGTSQVSVGLRNRTTNSLTLNYCEEQFGGEICYEIILQKR